MYKHRLSLELRREFSVATSTIILQLLHRFLRPMAMAIQGDDVLRMRGRSEIKDQEHTSALRDQLGLLGSQLDYLGL